MKTITVGQLRQNPTQALQDVERGEAYVITRHNRQIAQLVPIRDTGEASPAEAMAIYLHSPLPDDGWAEDVAATRTEPLADRPGW